MAVTVEPASENLAGRAPGRPLRIVLLAFYNYHSHALRIFHPLLKQRGHEVHSIFFKNYFTYFAPTQHEEDMVVDLIASLKPDVVCLSVWSTYYKLAARLTERIKAHGNPTIVWGGIHAQTLSEECLQHADVVCRGEGEHVLAEITDRLSLGEGLDDIHGCWVKRGSEVRKNPPRMLIQNLDVIPPADLSPANKYYMGFGAWRDVAAWDAQAISYDIMSVRGCPYECTFCIHNFTRKATEGMGSYIRRRSVEHVMRELRAAKATYPKLEAIAFSDDIFSPARPWLEEFCEVYPREIGLPFVIFSFPGMVDEKKVKLLRQAGLWCSTMGIQSGSERIRRDFYERETSDDTIIKACNLFAKYGVVRNLDFIGDNPYETDDDRRATVRLLARLPKPFYFNFFSLTYFPGVDLTTRALADGHIHETDLEHIAEKGYHLWGGALLGGRTDEQLYWDVVNAMALHGTPYPVIERAMDSKFFRRNIRQFARVMRRVRVAARWKARAVDQFVGRPNLLHHFFANTNRDETRLTVPIQPNFDNSPFSAPIESRPAA